MLRWQVVKFRVYYGVLGDRFNRVTGLTGNYVSFRYEFMLCMEEIHMARRTTSPTQASKTRGGEGETSLAG